MSSNQLEILAKEAVQLAELVRDFYGKGWVPATSSNFSMRRPSNSEQVLISQSGKDKQFMQSTDFMIVDQSGACILPEGAKPSAETLLHTTLYKYPHIGGVFHTHSLTSLLLADFFARNGRAEIDGLELLKAFSNETTHETKVSIPVFENTQDMNLLSQKVLQYIDDHQMPVGYIIKGHGVYVWGENVLAAKRHLEALEYLFEYKLRSKNHGHH